MKKSSVLMLAAGAAMVVGAYASTAQAQLFGGPFGFFFRTVQVGSPSQPVTIGPIRRLVFCARFGVCL